MMIHDQFPKGLSARVYAGDKSITVKTISEVIDAVQDLLETSNSTINIQWRPDSDVTGISQTLNLKRVMDYYVNIISNFLSCRSSLIDFVYDSEYYDENLEVTEIRPEAWEFHAHRFV